ncbi:MAG: PA14 domain-containing protein [Opitutales bacterium]|nr:PA14 domain-containing protein [Opitutales bacterium]MDG1324523.1 PA14 domain-containing protein [Opitutales bacterium]
MKFFNLSILAFVLITTCIQLNAAKPPKGFEKVDQSITISTLEAQMKYDVSSFSVTPNAKIKVVFKNPDSLPHNLIFCTPGKKKGGDKGQEVIDAVLKLGDQGVKMDWEPKGHPRILASSGMVQPGKEVTFYFKTPKAEGDYPYICTFPGHYQLMNGVMGVTKKANPITNLSYKIYHGEWSKVPDFSGLEPKKTGTLANGLFDITRSEIKNNFGFVFQGEIECIKKGKYSFTLSSDDGSILFINDKVVVDNDGIHGIETAKGSIDLNKGKHNIEVRYFERGGGESLTVSWSGPGFKNKALSKSLPKRGQLVEGMLLEAPKGEAIIYRNFIDGAGPRAIGVGYHEGLNLAFDANNMRLAMIWHGDFIDGARHWIARGQGFQPPAGNGVVRFPEGLAIAQLRTQDAAWPKSEYRTQELEFEGYVLDNMQRPTFKYSRNQVSIMDNAIALAGSSAEVSGAIKRLISFSGKEGNDNLFFRLAAGSFEKMGDFYRSDELTIQVEGGAVFQVKDELRVPITFQNNKAKLEIIYSWAD